MDKMNFDWNAYQEEALKTDSTANKEPELKMLHALMGLGGELAEAIETNRNLINATDDNDQEKIQEAKEELTLELGDVLWYNALYNKALDELALKHGFIQPENFQNSIETPFGTLRGFTVQHHLHEMLLLVGTAQDVFKKIYIYGKQMDKESYGKLRSLSLSIPHRFVSMVESIPNGGLTKEDIATINLKKLRARYEDRKFVLQQSNERDYVKEEQATGCRGK